MLLDKIALPAFALKFALVRAGERLGLGARGAVPLSLDELDADWFAAHMGAGTLPESALVTGGSSGTTQRRGFALNWGAGTNLPADVFVKMSASLGTRLTGAISGAMENEAWFYNALRPKLGIEAPAGYYAAFDAFSGSSIQVIEDVAATKGAVFLNALTPISRDMAEGQMALLAALHGQGKALAVQPGTPKTYCEFMGLSNDRAMIKTFHFRGLKKAADTLPPRFRARMSESWNAVLASIAAHKTLPHTVIHSDVHPGNWYQCNDGRMGLMDWQCVTRGHWSRDLAYCLSAGLTIENRRAWERDLIALYLGRLAAAGGDAMPFDDAFTHYRRQLPSALGYWTPTYAPPPFFPAMQPEEFAAEIVLRTATAIDDLDALHL